MPGYTLYQVPNSSVWRVQFSAEGRRYRLSTGATDRQEAEELAAQLYLTHTGGTPAGTDLPPLNPRTDPPQHVITRHCEDLERAGRSPDTVQSYLRYGQKYIGFFGVKPFGHLTRADAERWRDWLAECHRTRAGHCHKTLSPRTVSEHINWLASLLKHFNLPNVTQGVHRPRATHAERQRKRSTFTAEEIDLLFEHCPRHLRPGLVFLAYTGVRIGEMRGLRRGPDMLETEQIIWVTGKGSKRRQLTLTGAAQPAWDALQAQISRHRVPDGAFVWPQAVNWMSNNLRRLCRRVGIPERGPHTLRHTFATHALLFWGWDISLLAKWLGHEDINVTYSIYGHLIPRTPPAIWTNARLVTL